jgi:hypothetical protein
VRAPDVPVLGEDHLRLVLARGVLAVLEHLGRPAPSRHGVSVVLGRQGRPALQALRLALAVQDRDLGDRGLAHLLHHHVAVLGEGEALLADATGRTVDGLEGDRHLGAQRPVLRVLDPRPGQREDRQRLAAPGFPWPLVNARGGPLAAAPLARGIIGSAAGRRGAAGRSEGGQGEGEASAAEISSQLGHPGSSSGGCRRAPGPRGDRRQKASPSPGRCKCSVPSVLGNRARSWSAGRPPGQGFARMQCRAYEPRAAYGMLAPSRTRPVAG